MDRSSENVQTNLFTVLQMHTSILNNEANKKAIRKHVTKAITLFS